MPSDERARTAVRGPRRPRDPELRQRLHDFLASLDLELPSPPSPETPLLASGVLDSLALFRLALWIEEETGRELRPGEFDMREEWESVGSLLAFLERHRDGTEERDA